MAITDLSSAPPEEREIPASEARPPN